VRVAYARTRFALRTIGASCSFGRAIGGRPGATGLAPGFDLTRVRVEVEEVVDLVATGDGVPQAGADEAGDRRSAVGDLGLGRDKRQRIVGDHAIGQAVAGVADTGQVEQPRFLADGERLGISEEGMIEF
jgi:hypothetical protein